MEVLQNSLFLRGFCFNGKCSHSLSMDEANRFLLLFFAPSHQSNPRKRTTMLAQRSVSWARRRVSVALRSSAVRAQSTQSTSSSSSPIAQDGRHENWREGIYDHDNEPK
jgi:hypothetical protein